MPGTYIAGEPVVTIAAFAPQLHVITSKQRPRKLTIHGSDGAEYVFLLKVSLILGQGGRGGDWPWEVGANAGIGDVGGGKRFGQRVRDCGS